MHANSKFFQKLMQHYHGGFPSLCEVQCLFQLLKILHYSLFEYISHIHSHSRYQEILTDPSYAGQFVLMTNPHIGNTGVNFGR